MLHIISVYHSSQIIPLKILYKLHDIYQVKSYYKAISTHLEIYANIARNTDTVIKY